MAAANLFTILIISSTVSAISDKSPGTVFDSCADQTMQIYQKCKPYATGEVDFVSKECCGGSGNIQDMARIAVKTPQTAWYRCEVLKRAAIKNKFIQERAEKIPILCPYRPIFMPFVPNIDCYQYWPTNTSSVSTNTSEQIKSLEEVA